MENPLKSMSQKDWLYVGGAVASIVALIAFIAYQKRVNVQSGTQSDIPNAVVATGANYLNTNVPDLGQPPIQAGADTAPNVQNTSCSGCECAGPSQSQFCTGTSPLSSGNTFSSTDALIQYYQNTNPIYVQLQQVQLQKYAALFATGESYSKGGTPLGVSYEGP